ncbi:acyltransferase LovD [Cladorrhinum samala]|uniref:Acyltransferase LovD n=1 Tax=Cladorrhinum samala TaxID=585594 RepID=A0AAV9H8P2_9PEZI|nr:acyltransferase LovD [Cladorrhinum samala]
MPNQTFEARIQKAVDDGKIPGAVLLARSKDGKINYSSAFRYNLDTVFTLASMTKLLAAISVLQLVDRGLVTLDTDVAEILPELAAQPVLVGFAADTGEPILERRKEPILLRHLLSHSSGSAYVFFDQKLGEHFAKSQREPPLPLSTSSSSGGRTVADKFGYPLIFEPGKGWAYGAGIDWAGEVVRRLGGGKGLDEWIRDNVLRPLGIGAGAGAGAGDDGHHPAVTFYPDRYEGLREGRIAIMGRGESAAPGFDRFFAFVGKEKTREEETDEMGGEGAYADLRAYMTVLESILADDGRLLSSETAQLLFEPLLEPEARRALNESVSRPEWIVGWVPGNDGEYDWSAGGLLTTKDEEGGAGRKKGYLQWGGAFNLSWFIDRTAGVAGIFGTQILQPADPFVKVLMKEYEEEIYKLL